MKSNLKIKNDIIIICSKINFFLQNLCNIYKNSLNYENKNNIFFKKLLYNKKLFNK